MNKQPQGESRVSIARTKVSPDVVQWTACANGVVVVHVTGSDAVLTDRAFWAGNTVGVDLVDEQDNIVAWARYHLPTWVP